MNNQSDFLDVYGNPVLIEPHRWTIATSMGIKHLPWAVIDRAGELLSSLSREYIRNRLLNESPIEAANLHKELSGFARFFKSIPEAPIHAAILGHLAYLTSKGSRCRWARVRSFYRFFAERRHPAFDQKALIEINRVVVGGNPKGVAVRTGDPVKGPMSREEAALWRDAILNDDDDSYSAIRERVVAILVTILGLRPTSIIHLMESDFVADVTVNDVPAAFALDISRAKKRVAPRTLHRRIPIHPQLAREIGRLITLNRSTHPEPLSEEERPLLFATAPNLAFGSLGWRESSAGVAAILQRAVQRYGVVSPRTQHPLVVFPTRLRRTAATALAREGHSTEQIAAFLDHEDLQHASVYTDAARGVIEQLDAALADTYAPFINAFKGAIPKPSAQKRRTKTVSYVTDAGRLHVLGECGQERVPCRLHAPYTCYSCELYEPFSDADHVALQRDLFTRRARLEKSTRLAERRMAPLLDRAIFGLAHVKLLIEEMELARKSA
jgi:hypothetical protein